jgi:hypothetical protein
VVSRKAAYYFTCLRWESAVARVNGDSKEPLIDADERKQPMKPVFSKTTERLLLIAKLSDDKMKLFLDVEPLVPAPKEEPPAEAAPTPEAPAAAGPDPVTAPSTTQTPPAPAAPEKSQTPKKETAKGPPPPVPLVPPVTRDELLAMLKEFMSLEYLAIDVIDDIAQILSGGKKVEERRIVKGVEPENGADGKILFLVKRLSGEVEISVDSKGLANLRMLHLFDNIAKGTIVARVYPPKNGVDGRDALGKVIQSKPGKPYKVNLERSLVLKASDSREDTFQIIVAESEGYLSEDGGRLAIREELVVNGNLDYHMGSIDFIGSVRIKGDVLPDFSVKAKILSGVCG